jgi:hypothetical protein
MWAIYKSQVAISVPFDNSTNGFTADNVQSAIEEAKLNAVGFPRAGVRSTYNSTVTASQWLGPSELHPNTPLVLPAVNLLLNEISWSNQTTNVAFRIQFRTVSKTGTIVYTLTVTSPNSGYGFATGINLSLTAGVPIYAQYLDDGNNCSDMDLILWVSRIS